MKKNPKSVEEYLQQANEDDVLLYAFYFQINSRWGYDFWCQMQKDFLDYLKKHEEDEGQDEWYLLHGKCKILRTNWDSQRYWRQETKADTCKRLGIELPEYETMEEKKPKEAATPMDDKPTNSSIQDYLFPKKEEPKEDDSIFGEFEFVDTRSRAQNRRRLARDEFSVNTRGERCRITFNQWVSNEVKARGGYEYAALMKNKKGDVLVILNDTRGVTLQDGGVRKSTNVAISSKTLVEKVVDFLNIENDYEIIRATEVEKTKDYVAYLLTKIK